LDFTLPRDIEGGYRLLRKIGEGGMGIVYEGVHIVLERPVAIKMMLPSNEESEEAETVAKRFLREAKTIARVQSDHVVDIMHFGRTKNGELFLVMEFIQGCTLAQYLRHCKRLSPELTCHIGSQVASGLMAAHNEGIIHRDLKAANVMLTDKGSNKLFAKVLDFGVAKLTDEGDKTLTQAGLMVGTLSTMSPEQITGSSIDHRSDIYAMGVLLYRMISGKRLFEVTDVAGVSYHHVHEKPKAFSERVPDLVVPEQLEAIIFRCLEKKPEHRFQKMLDIVLALKDVFAQQHFDMVTDTGNYLIEPQQTHSEQATRTVLAIDPSSLSVSAKPTSSGMRLKKEQISESQAQTLTGASQKNEDGHTLATQHGVSLSPNTMTQTHAPQAAWLKTIWLFAGVLVIAAATWTILDRIKASSYDSPEIKPDKTVNKIVDAEPEPATAVPPPKKEAAAAPVAAPTAPPVVAPTAAPVASPTAVPEKVEVELPATPASPQKKAPNKALKKKLEPASQKRATKKSKPKKKNSGFIRTTPKPSGFIRTSSEKKEKGSSFRRVQTE